MISVEYANVVVKNSKKSLAKSGVYEKSEWRKNNMMNMGNIIVHYKFRSNLIYQMI